jgi:hypothetical protein
MTNNAKISIFVILISATIFVKECYSLSTIKIDYRKSTLVSWEGNIDLGHCVEERSSAGGDDDDDEAGSSLIKIKTIHGGNGDDDDDNNDNEFILKFPEIKKDNNGSLASQHCISAFASSILLQSNEFKEWSINKDIAELGAGRGLAGMVAAEKSNNCIITEYDDEAIELLQETINANKDENDENENENDNNNSNLQATITTKKLDWRDDNDDIPFVDLVLGSDIAYYYHLLRPIMDTSRKFMTSTTGTGSSSKKSGSIFIVGQANRESQWDLYTNIKNGCYNQLTDENELPWKGVTKLYLYNLQISTFCDNKNDCDLISNIDGIIPIHLIIHHDPDTADEDTAADDNNDNHPSALPPKILIPFEQYAYEATEADYEDILKTF